MSEISTSYQLANHIHASFFDCNDFLTAAEIEASGVNSRVGSNSSSTSQRIEVLGVVNGRPAAQMLARDKFGTYHLSTTFREYNGEHVQSDVPPNAPFEAIEVLAGTIFMHKLVEIAHTRNQG